MKWFVYKTDSGRFTGESFESKDQRVIDLALKRRPGCAAIEGEVDPRTQCVDIQTGMVVSSQEVATQFAAAEKRENALRVLQSLEAKQHRRVRELLAQSDPQLAELDAKIEEQRALLNETGTSARADRPN